MTYLTLIEADQVTPEVLALVDEIESGWFQDIKIDWAEFIDRMDGALLEDGTVLDMGYSLLSPAILLIKAHVQALRRSQ